MKKCKYCQSDIDSKAKFCLKCGKKQSHTPVWMRILGIFIIIIGVVYLFGRDEESAEPKEEEKGCYATLEKFNEIQHGMTYEEVVNIIGCDGTLSSDVGAGSYNIKMYYWYAENNVSNMVLSFDNGKLSGKNQIGLDK